MCVSFDSHLLRPTPHEFSWTRSHAHDLTDLDPWSGRCWATSDRALTSLLPLGTTCRCRSSPIFHQGNRFSSITSGRLLSLRSPVDLVVCPLQLAFLGLLWRFLAFHLLLVFCKPWFGFNRDIISATPLLLRSLRQSFPTDGNEKVWLALHFVAIPSFLQTFESSCIDGRGRCGRMRSCCYESMNCHPRGRRFVRAVSTSYAFLVVYLYRLLEFVWGRHQLIYQSEHITGIPQIYLCRIVNQPHSKGIS